MALPIGRPHPVISNPQAIRAYAVLPPAGAFDAAPVELDVAGFDHLMLFVTYLRDPGSILAGAVQLRPEVSPYAAPAAVVAPQENWFRGAVYAAAVLVPGADVVSPIQREDLQYVSVGAAAETFVYGPIVLAAAVERFRLACAETGDVGLPGICEVIGVLYE